MNIYISLRDNPTGLRIYVKSHTWHKKLKPDEVAHTFLSAGDILFVSVPAMIMQSDCRGLARKTTPKRSMSYRGAAKCIISIAQHARPKVIGHNELWQTHIADRFEHLMLWWSILQGLKKLLIILIINNDHH